MEPHLDRSTRRLGRRILFSLLAATLVGAAVEGISATTLVWRYGRGQARPAWAASREYDPLLGWRYVSNNRSSDRPAGSQIINGQGLRAPEDYPAEIPAGRYRIICLGDSFTFGGRDDRDTYPARLESLAPRVQAVNMGSGGYGLDQMYLRYKRDGLALRTDALLLAVINEDFRRMANDTFLYAAPKPMLVIESGRLGTRNVPVPRWGQLSSDPGFLHAYKRTATFRLFRKAAFDYRRTYDYQPVAERVLKDLNDMSRARRQRFVVMYLPVRDDLAASHPLPERGWLAAFCRAAGIEFLDLFHVFRRVQNPGDYFADDGHYSGRGYALVATAMLDFWQRELRHAAP